MLFRSRWFLMAILILFALCVGTVLFANLRTFAKSSKKQSRAASQASKPGDLPYRVFLPLMQGTSCENVEGETYASLVVNPPPTDRPADQHADLNLALRGYNPTVATLGLVEYSGSTDMGAPQLDTLFGDARLPEFSSVSQVNDWDWACNCRAEPISEPEVTLTGLNVMPNQALHVPASGYNIGTRPQHPARGFYADRPIDDPNVYETLVLYATAERITLKYTREDNVVNGYTIHVENVCIAPDLLNVYNRLNEAGRIELPALKAGQSFGRAIGDSLGIAIRDSGAFMDPRSHKDWWRDQ